MQYVMQCVIVVSSQLQFRTRPIGTRRLLHVYPSRCRPVVSTVVPCQVHEKSLLLPLCPLAFLWADAPLLVTWLQVQHSIVSSAWCSPLCCVLVFWYFILASHAVHAIYSALPRSTAKAFVVYVHRGLYRAGVGVTWRACVLPCHGLVWCGVVVAHLASCPFQVTTSYSSNGIELFCCRQKYCGICTGTGVAAGMARYLSPATAGY